MRLLVPALLLAASIFAAPAKVPFGRKNATPKASPTAQAVVVNAASYLPGISPGALATIFGQDLSTVDGVVIAGTDPLPLVLANVSIRVNGRSAPVFSVAYANGQDQISFQVPYRTETGPNAAEIEVFDFGDRVADIVTDSFTQDPGIFVYQGIYAVAASATDYSLIGPNNPAFTDEIITLYTTGLGPLTLDLRDGYGAPSNPLAYTTEPSDVYLDGQRCDVLFSGLSPGFVGLYQVNFVVPRNARAGNLDLQIRTTYGDSGIATLPVR